MNSELTKLINNFKENPTQEKYNTIIVKLFTNIDQTFLLPSKVRIDNNGFDLKSIYDENGKNYLIVYTDPQYIKNEDESFLKVTFKGILEKILEYENCDGILINPDLKISKENNKNQLIILKDYIVKIYNI